MMDKLTKKQIMDIITNKSLSIGERECGKTMFTKMVNELLEYKGIEERLGCPLDVFIKLHEVNGIYCEIQIALSSFPSKTVYLEIDKLRLDGIHFKKNEYDLWFIEYKYYKECFWIERDKSE